jgi:hypothetical protein
VDGLFLLAFRDIAYSCVDGDHYSIGQFPSRQGDARRNAKEELHSRRPAAHPSERLTHLSEGQPDVAEDTPEVMRCLLV